MLEILAKLTTPAPLWCTVFVGCGTVALALTDLYMLGTGSEPGTAIYLDELAPTPGQAFLQLACGCALVVIPFLLRAAVTRRIK